MKGLRWLFLPLSAATVVTRNLVARPVSGMEDVCLGFSILLLSEALGVKKAMGSLGWAQLLGSLPSTALS